MKVALLAMALHACDSERVLMQENYCVDWDAELEVTFFGDCVEAAGYRARFDHRPLDLRSTVDDCLVIARDVACDRYALRYVEVSK